MVEGFYGPPWSHADRCWLVERIGSWGMNRYVYAPKDDPLHRAEWRTPYPTGKLREFAELIEIGARAGVDVGFAVSPGLSITYADAADRAALAAKYASFRELGARFFALTVDDVPAQLVHEADRAAFPSLAAAHVGLAHGVAEAIGPEATLWLVPTEYVATEPTAYLEELGLTLDPAIEVGWTGRTVVSPTIEAAEARARSATLRRPLLVWDNAPVSDGPMRAMLHLGPYLGRDPDLTASVCGALLNPMELAHASAVMLRTAADQLASPASYDAEVSWARAVEELGAGAPAAFRTFARAHRFSALAPEDRDAEVESAWSALRGAIEGRGPVTSELSALRALLGERLRAADALRADLSDRALAAEIEPWLTAHHDETRRMAAALDLLATLASDASRFHRALALLGFEGRLSRIPTASVASYGPRRVVYPQLVGMREDSAGFGADPVLYRDLCLADEIVRFAEDLALAAERR